MREARIAQREPGLAAQNGRIMLKTLTRVSGPGRLSRGSGGLGLRKLQGLFALPRLSSLRTAWGAVLRSERGDVPGWVLITLMTAGLVALIWALAGPALGMLFDQAIARVSGF